jgi:hypothetical protein
MFSSLILAAAVASGPLGLSASPAAIDAAVAHHTYTIQVTDTGRSPVTIHASLAPAGEANGGCAVVLGARVLTSWAHIDGRTTFRLRPSESRRVHVRIGQPPPGRSELVAAFVASDPSHGSVAASAGVGTALRFSEPGRTEIAPCPLIRHHADPTSVRTVAARSSEITGGLIGLAFAILAAMGLGSVVTYLVARKRRKAGGPMT